MMDLAIELPISGHNLERHVLERLGNNEFERRLLQRAAENIRREWLGKDDNYGKFWNLVDAEILERMATRTNPQPENLLENPA